MVDVEVVEVDSVVVVVTGAVVFSGPVVTIGELVLAGVQAAATKSTAARASRRIMGSPLVYRRVAPTSSQGVSSGSPELGDRRHRSPTGIAVGLVPGAAAVAVA